jgi:hypothetical protein
LNSKIFPGLYPPDPRYTGEGKREGEGILGQKGIRDGWGGREGRKERKEKGGGRERGRENGINLGPPNVWGKFTPVIHTIQCNHYKLRTTNLIN